MHHGRPEQIRELVMDMAPPFIRGAREHLGDEIGDRLLTPATTHRRMRLGQLGRQKRGTRMNEMQPEPAWRRSAREVPTVAWLLGALAVVEALVLALARGLFETDPFPLGVLVSVLTSATPFILGAGVLIGARRWPAGRTWFLAAAAAFVLRGVLDAGLDLWLATSLPNNPPTDLSTWNAWMMARGLVAAALTLAAPASAAIGIWIASASTPPLTEWRRWAAVGLAALGLLATAVGGSLAVAPGTAGADGWLITASVLYMVAAQAAVAFAALAIAALRAMSDRDRSPELLMVGGVVVVLAATVWLDLGFQQMSTAVFSVGWWLTLPNALVLIGLLAVAAGFATGGLTEPER